MVEVDGKIAAVLYTQRIGCLKVNGEIGHWMFSFCFGIGDVFFPMRGC